MLSKFLIFVLLIPCTIVVSGSLFVYLFYGVDFLLSKIDLILLNLCFWATINFSLIVLLNKKK